MDPDREALRRAIDTRMSGGPYGNATPHMMSYDEVDHILVAAARRDLARLEGERKRATLQELIEYAAASNVTMARANIDLDEEIAAVLRAVWELRE